MSITMVFQFILPDAQNSGNNKYNMSRVVDMGCQVSQNIYNI